jgi:hypothetical protein
MSAIDFAALRAQMRAEATRTEGKACFTLQPRDPVNYADFQARVQILAHALPSAKRFGSQVAHGQLASVYYIPEVNSRTTRLFGGAKAHNERSCRCSLSPRQTRAAFSPRS